MSDKKFVLITGAGKGLGKAFARQCAEMGFNMILLALPGENTHSLARHIQHQFDVAVLFMSWICAMSKGLQTL